jgi:hypothetical protein
VTKPRKLSKDQRKRNTAVQLARDARLRAEMAELPYQSELTIARRLAALRQATKAFGDAQQAIVAAQDLPTIQRLTAELPRLQREVVRCRVALGMPAEAQMPIGRRS